MAKKTGSQNALDRTVNRRIGKAKPKLGATHGKSKADRIFESELKKT